MKIEVKSRWSGLVLFSLETRSLKLCLEAAVRGGADLYGADLYGADLYGANLGGASLGGANLRGANLGGANLGGANLGGANLGGANLGGANLYGASLGGANLRGANLGGKKLIGERPFLQLGPIGSRADYVLAFITDRGILVKAGCWSGWLDDFVARVQNEHGDSVHSQEYRAAAELIRLHAKLWPGEITAKPAKSVETE